MAKYVDLIRSDESSNITRLNRLCAGDFNSYGKGIDIEVGTPVFGVTHAERVILSDQACAALMAYGTSDLNEFGNPKYTDFVCYAGTGIAPHGILVDFYSFKDNHYALARFRNTPDELIRSSNIKTKPAIYVEDDDGHLVPGHESMFHHIHQKLSIKSFMPAACICLTKISIPFLKTGYLANH